MTQEQYKTYLKVANTITKKDPRTSDLVHDVMISLLNNEYYKTLPEKAGLYFFIKAIKNQFYSNSSYFYRDYRKHSFSSIEYIDISEEEKTPEKPSIDWITEQLQHLDWYERGLFELYMEKPVIKHLSEKTNIPIYSVRKSIKETKKFLLKRWELYLERN